MAIIPFNQFNGTYGNDSFSGGNNSVYFGLQGNDVFESQLNSAWIGFVGGQGNDTYIVSNNSAITIGENGNSNGDKLVAQGISINTSWARTIDNRHLLIADTSSGQQVLILDWTIAANRIETVELAEGTYSYNTIATYINTLLTTARNYGYKTNYSWAELTVYGFIDPSTGADFSQTYSYYMNMNARLEDTVSREIFGTFGNDILVGGNGADSIFGLEGNDLIKGGCGRRHVGGRSRGRHVVWRAGQRCAGDIGR